MQGKTKFKRIPLGETTVFKPLQEGESLTAYLESPPKTAWMQTSSGEEMRVGFEIKPGHPERKVPDVDLHIVKIEASEAK